MDNEWEPSFSLSGKNKLQIRKGWNEACGAGLE